MAFHQQTKAARRWRRNRRIQALKAASDKTFEGCGPMNVCYGVPFPSDGDDLSDEDLAQLEQVLAKYL